jgi:hypothetical protein
MNVLLMFVLAVVIGTAQDEFTSRLRAEAPCIKRWGGVVHAAERGDHVVTSVLAAAGLPLAAAGGTATLVVVAAWRFIRHELFR